MIHLIILNAAGRPIQHRMLQPPRRGRARLLTPDMPIGDPIYIRPDWPPIGSPDFADKLRAWHAQNNGPAACHSEPRSGEESR